MANLYLVVSGQLTEVVGDDWFNQVGHEETYGIAELVVANSRGQARWLAWKSDSFFTGNVRDMPKFRTALKQKGLSGPPRIASREFDSESDDMWRWLWELPHD